MIEVFKWSPGKLPVNCPMTNRTFNLLCNRNPKELEGATWLSLKNKTVLNIVGNNVGGRAMIDYKFLQCCLVLSQCQRILAEHVYQKHLSDKDV